MRHLALALAACLCTLPAHARLITFEFTGVVNWINEYDAINGISRPLASSNLAPARVAVGERFHGRFSYDTDMTAAPLPVAGVADYRGGPRLPVHSFIRFDGGLSSTSSLLPPEITVQDDRPDNVSEGFYYRAAAAAAQDRFGIILSDASGTVFSEPSLPSSLSLSWFEHANASYLYRNDTLDRTLLVDGTLLTLRDVSPVPEPSSYALMLLGCAVLAGALRRRGA